ncbi:MAG: dipeptidase [Acidobacteria bacterium]|nr:dipeptidase [Acidobacteriota bacterium]
MNRRNMLQRSLGAAAAIAAAPLINRGRFQLLAQSDKKYSSRAVELVRRSTVIDMLNPFSMPSLFRITKRNWFLDPATFTSKDLQRFKEGGYTVLHVGGGAQTQEDVLKFHTWWNGFIAHHSDSFMRVDSPRHLASVKGSGKIGIILGVQDSAHFYKLDDVNEFYSFGQRVSQLTYNARNLLGNGCAERRDGGLSDFGVSVVERMNQLGMVVDVSHCGDRTTLDALEVSKQPVLFTHSNCRALVPNQPRCKTDEAIKKMAAKGGVMGITGMRMFVRDTEPTTIEHMLDHYDHVARWVGVEHVGIGSDTDLDGYDSLPAEFQTRLRAAYKSSIGFRKKTDIDGVDHHMRTFDLAEGLVRRGYSDHDIELILGGNFQRVLSAVWAAREAAPQAGGS